MGNYSVPEEIRKLKPAGTMVKKIAGHYYVYEYSKVKDGNGKRITKMGQVIGTIREGAGFVPNGHLLANEEISTLEFGDYAVAISNSGNTRALLEKCFNKGDADRIYTVALIHCVNGFTYMKDIHHYYEMSCLCLRYPGMKLGYDSLSGLYENLGRRQGPVLALEEQLINNCSREIAIDGHVIGGGSLENDLAEKGYKFWKLGEAQVNLLMAYDINTGVPLLSKIYEGGSADNVSVRDLMEQVQMKDLLFIVDRGFYSAENLELFSKNGNSYIIPLRKNHTLCRKAVSRLEMLGRFVYQKGRRGSIVEYKDETIDGQRILTFRDVDESVAEQTNYLRHMNQGNHAYTQESFDAQKDYMGVMVLQTNLSKKSPQEIFELYKKRWKIETYYNYFKNKADCTALFQQDYYKTQGLAFLMLISSLIFHELEEAVKHISSKSVQDCLLEARMVKAEKRHDVWRAANCLKKQKDLFKLLNTSFEVIPSSTVT